MLIKILHRVMLLIALVVPLYAVAQEASDGRESSEIASKERIEDLIVTIESETGRQKLIEDLKLLLNAQGDESGDAASADKTLADVLNISDATEAWRSSYRNFLERHDLDGSAVGRIVGTAVILLAAWFLVVLVRKVVGWAYNHMLPAIEKLGLRKGRIHFYTKGLRLFGYILVAGLAIAALLSLWGLDLAQWISVETQLSVIQSLITIAVVFAIGAVIIEISDGAMHYLFNKASGPVNARMQTLFPIARNVVFITLFTLFGLTLLSELGINVMPLMAGAGVVGFAVGFGAQTLIKDVLTGFIIIIEDLIQVGDVARVGDRIGLVERITIRKVQLRDLTGTVYTVPFSEISIVENLTKDFSYYLMDVGVAYRENTDEVIDLLRQVDEEMRQDPKYNTNILEPLEVLGVDRFADSAVIVKARIKTRPIKQWEVGREFNRRMKMLFDQKGVEIPFPHRTLYFGVGKNGSAPSMKVDVLDGEAGTRAAANDEGVGRGKGSKTLSSDTPPGQPRDGFGDNSESDETT